MTVRRALEDYKQAALGFVECRTWDVKGLASARARLEETALNYAYALKAAARKSSPVGPSPGYRMRQARKGR